MPTPTSFDPAALTPDMAACASEDSAMAALRQQAWDLADGSDWSRHDDHQVITALQQRPAPAAAGAPVMYRLVLQASAATAPSEAAPAPAPPRPAQAATPAAAGADDDSAFSADIDAAAMAQALQAAARDGVPFCEECERARRAAAATA